MKLSKSNIKIILFIVAVAILGLTYLYVFKDNMSTADSIQSEVDTLQARYDELNAKQKDRDMYEEKTAEYEKLFADRLAYFPATLDQEISVMFIKGVEKDEGNLQFGVNSVGLGQPETFYSLSAAASASNDKAIQKKQQMKIQRLLHLVIISVCQQHFLLHIQDHMKA